MSALAQKFENGLCRCCLSEGLFKSLSDIDCSEYNQEIFAVTLKNCFSISLSPMFGQYSETTYGICDMCIYKLREANSFKNLVQESETKFQQLYSNHIFKELEPTPQFKDEQVIVKPPMKRPKIEKNIEEIVVASHIDMEDDDVNDGDDHDNADDDDANDDSFDFNFDDSDDDDKTLFDLRKAKPKPKKAAKKKAVKLQDIEKKSEEKPKKGKKAKTSVEPKAKTADKEKPADAEATERPKVIKRGPARITHSKYYICSVDQVTGDLIYTCRTCDKTTTSQDQMVRHKKTHLVRDRTMQTCRHCGQEVKVYALAYHIEEQHGIPAPTCEICGKKFSMQNRLEEHLKNVHLHQKPFICSICEAGFFHKYRLQRHMAAHTGERKYKCHICEKTFAWDANFRLHMKAHDKPNVDEFKN